MKNLFVISLCLVIGLWACGADHAKPKEAKTSAPAVTVTETKAATKTDTLHVQVYACPMHPEVTGKEGDKCSKCGMALVHR
jgi:hypothetical protein